jgi:hypothetical protein
MPKIDRSNRLLTHSPGNDAPLHGVADLGPFDPIAVLRRVWGNTPKHLRRAENGCNSVAEHQFPKLR